jgi:transposase
MDMRELKGLEIAARCKIAFSAGAWIVPSQSGKGTYRVILKPDGDSCPCDDFALTGKPCKHIHAARIVRERDRGGASVPLDMDVVPKRPTYKQDWPAYNLAQSTEKHRFQVLLHDLCRGVAEPPPARISGRRRHTSKDTLFAMAFKVYGTFSSRRFTCDLKDAHEKGYLSKPIPGVKVCAFFENADLTPVLHSLIVESSLPLRAVETVFAPDSTGFSTSRFVRWFDEKYGVTRSGKDWIKAHAICGVKTNVVTAVEILDRNAGDSPQLPALVNRTVASGFTVKEVPADKAYLSHVNLNLIAGLGAEPFVPFKVNSQQGEAGSVWEKMHLYYQLRREEFLAHYHKRSNAESTFSMVKAKFRDHVRSKTQAAMVNEVLCKFLCHNICVLIQSQCELGIDVTFWPAEPTTEDPDVLPLVRPVA